MYRPRDRKDRYRERGTTIQYHTICLATYTELGLAIRDDLLSHQGRCYGESRRTWYVTCGSYERHPECPGIRPSTGQSFE